MGHFRDIPYLSEQIRIELVLATSKDTYFPATATAFVQGVRVLTV